MKADPVWLNLKRKLEQESVDPSTLPRGDIAQLLLVISSEVAVGEFSFFDRMVMETAASLLTEAAPSD